MSAVIFLVMVCFPAFVNVTVSALEKSFLSVEYCTVYPLLAFATLPIVISTDLTPFARAVSVGVDSLWVGVASFVLL